MKSISYAVVLSILVFSALFGQTDRSKPPAAGQAPVINISDYKSFELTNGLKVFVIENHKLPVVSLRLTVDYDPVQEGSKTGCASAAGIMLRMGTKTKTKDQIDREIDLIGASVTTSEKGLFASSLKKHAETLFNITSDITINAQFHNAELEKTKQLMLSDYEQGKEDPNEIADRITRKIYYGTEHPYGSSFTDITINNITLESCTQFYDTYFRPNISYLAIVGDITLKEAKALTEKYFSLWVKKEVPGVSYTTPVPPAANEVSIVDRGNSVQSVIHIGHPVQLTPGAPDAIAARVTNTLLGGGVFRLFNNLREKHGYTYGAYSTLQSDKYIGSFMAAASVRNAVTDSAIAEFLYEMKRIRNEPVSDEELTKTKNYLTGGFAISLESPQTVADFAINTARYKLPKDYYKNYLKNLAAVSKQDVQKAANKYILPDKSHIIIVGSATETAPQLAAFSANGKVNRIDTDGNPVIIEAKAPPANVTAENVIEKYVQAIGGAEAMRKVKDRTTTITTKAMGMDIKATVYQKYPNKYLAVTDLGMMGKQSVVFDGENGKMESPMGSMDLKDSSLADQAFMSDMTAMLRLKELGVSAKLLGVENVNSSPAYKIELTIPGAHPIVQFYDTGSFLKVKEERIVEMPVGTFRQVMEFSDYKQVGDMRYPFLSKQMMGTKFIEMRTAKIIINSNLGDEIFK